MELKVINPYSQEAVCRLPYDDDEAVQQKLAHAAEAQRVWVKRPVKERIAIVEAGLARFRDIGDRVASEITDQMGKPLKQAKNELRTMCDRAEYMLSIGETSLAADILTPKDGFERRIEHVPHGVVLNIAAWNYPLLLPINVIVPALVAGNTVLLKHSAKTPLVGRAFAEAFGDLEVKHLVQDVLITHKQTAALVGDARIGYVAFTGSVEGGYQIYAESARHMKDAGLELGGKDPAYVAADAPFDFTVENVVDGACYNAGQSCSAVERVYVHESLHDRFVDAAKKAMEGYVMGDPHDEKTTLGPLSSRSALDTMERQVEDAVSRGAKLLLGGKRVEGSSGYFFPPTLLTDVPNDAEVMQEETFGPILPILKVTGDDEAVRMMNESRYGLTASVWTADNERAERFGRDVNAGTIYQNRADYLDPALPWTGIGDSGMGSTLSSYGYWHLTRRKSIHFRRAP